MVVLKHMILLKQNRWPPEIYNNYTALLKRDVLFTVQNHYDLDISLSILSASFIPPHSCYSRANWSECYCLVLFGLSPLFSQLQILHTVFTCVLLPLRDSFTVAQWVLLILGAIAVMCGMKVEEKEEGEA